MQSGMNPMPTALTVDVGFDDVGSYHGIALKITGSKESRDSFGTKICPMVFEVEFQPDGAILSIKNLF